MNVDTYSSQKLLGDRSRCGKILKGKDHEFRKAQVITRNQQKAPRSWLSEKSKPPLAFEDARLISAPIQKPTEPSKALQRAIVIRERQAALQVGAFLPHQTHHQRLPGTCWNGGPYTSRDAYNGCLSLWSGDMGATAATSAARKATRKALMRKYAVTAVTADMIYASAAQPAGRTAHKQLPGAGFSRKAPPLPAISYDGNDHTDYAATFTAFDLASAWEDSIPAASTAVTQGAASAASTASDEAVAGFSSADAALDFVLVSFEDARPASATISPPAESPTGPASAADETPESFSAPAGPLVLDLGLLVTLAQQRQQQGKLRRKDKHRVRQLQGAAAGVEEQEADGFVLV